jgi:membrane protein implicated in regulation of membrane protease activity
MPITNTTLIWLIAGAVLCFTELFVPSAFVSMMMGISAIVVALLAPVFSNLWLQVVVWLLLSTALIVVSRRFVKPSRHRAKIRDAIVAETLTEIPLGKTGRVLYEGNSWQARCDADISIAAYQRVYVVRREGTTLIVMPENLLHS